MTDDTRRRYERRQFLKAVGAAGVAAGIAGRGSAATGERLVIGVEDGADIEAIRQSITADPEIPDSAEIVHHNEKIDYAVLEITGPTTQSTEPTTAAVGKHDGVAYAETDYEIELEVEEIQAVSPDDPRWGEEWADEAINVPTAWETTMGSMDSTLAILDTGLDVTHPDLQDRVTDEVGGPDPVPSGSDDHGTHCGGCAAATTNNGVGVAGPTNSRLLGYNIFDNVRGEDAIIEASDLGADVISLSWSVGYSRQQSLHDAIQYATDNGTVVVAASANDGRTDAVTYPAMDPNVIAVGATDQNGNVASFSNSGPNLDLVAPGVGILSTLPQESYGRASGTSMACPVTAGVVALAKELDPSLTTEEVRTLLTDTATTLSGVPSDRQAAGQVDAAAVVSELGSGGGGGGGGDQPAEQSPYQRDSGWPLPGRIQAENYDLGGEGVAYHDTDSSNIHGAYRQDAVDIESSADGGYNVAEIITDEWLEYTVEVGSAGEYDLTARVASNEGGGAFRIEVDGSDVTGTVSVPGTGGWQSWTTVSAQGVSLSAGEHVVRVYIEDGLFNLDWFEFAAPGDETPPSAPSNLRTENVGTTSVDLAWDAAADDGTGVDHYDVYVDGSVDQSVSGTTATVSELSPDTSYDVSVTAVDAAGNESGTSNALTLTTNASDSQQPYNGPHTVPGTVQAQDFDQGGQDVSYFDTTETNAGGAYRETRVDIEPSTEDEYNVGWMQTDEWLEYTVQVETAGTYDVGARVASNNGGGAFHVSVDGSDVTGTVSAPGTGGWQAWTTVTIQNVDLTAGEHVLRFAVDDGGFNLNRLEFTQSGQGSGGDQGIVSGGTYRITNVNSGKVLDVEGGSTLDGANVVQWESNGGANQQWTVEEVENGVYRLIAGHSSKVLDVHDALQDPGTNVKQWEYVGGDHQHFRIEDAGDGTYGIVADHSDLALDVWFSSTDDGANVVQWRNHGGTNQRWQFERLD